MENLPDWAGTLPSWLSAGGILGGVGLFLRTHIANRKLTIEDNRGIRSEFIDEMRALREDMKGLRTENSGLHAAVSELREENTNLRREIRELHGVIDGLRRQTLTGQIETQRTIVESLPPDVVSPAISNALRQLNSVRGTGE